MPVPLILPKAYPLKIASRILLICLFLLLVGITPWVLMAFDADNSTLARVILGVEAVALIALILDLVIFKNIDRSFGQPVNSQTAQAPFSVRRMAYLLFVYTTPVSAALGLLACLH